MKSNSMFPKIVLVSFFTMALGIGVPSCKRTEKIPTIEESPSKPQIAFLSMEISGKANTTSKIIVRDKKIVDGKMKDHSSSELQYKNYLLIEHLFSDQKEIQIIEHPLYRNVEFVGDNGLGRKEIELEKAEFFIRLQKRSSRDKVIIYEQLGDQKKEIIKINL